MSIFSQPPSAEEKPDLAYIESVADDQCKGADGKGEGTLKLAEQQLLSVGRPRWEVIKDNKRAMLVIMIMLVCDVRQRASSCMADVRFRLPSLSGAPMGPSPTRSSAPSHSAS